MIYYYSHNKILKHIHNNKTRTPFHTIFMIDSNISTNIILNHKMHKFLNHNRNIFLIRNNCIITFQLQAPRYKLSTHRYLSNFGKFRSYLNNINKNTQHTIHPIYIKYNTVYRKYYINLCYLNIPKICKQNMIYQTNS